MAKRSTTESRGVNGFSVSLAMLGMLTTYIDKNDIALFDSPFFWSQIGGGDPWSGGLANCSEEEGKRLKEYMDWLVTLDGQEKIDALTMNCPNYPDRVEDQKLWKKIYARSLSMGFNNMIEKALTALNIHPAMIMADLGSDEYPTAFTREWTKYEDKIVEMVFGADAMDQNLESVARVLVPYWARIGVEQNNRIRKRKNNPKREEEFKAAKEKAEEALKGV